MSISSDKEEKSQKRFQNGDSGIILNDRIYLNFMQVKESIKVYEIAMNHQKVSDANVFTNKTGVTDVDLCNKIRLTIKQNINAVRDFLLSEENELHLEFIPKTNRRKRSGLNLIF